MAFSAHGTSLTIDDGNGTPIEIGQLTAYSGFDGEAPDLQTTTFATTGGYHTFRQGLMDHGGFSVDVFRDPSDPGQAECLAISEAQETREFVLTFEEWGTVTFNAYCKVVPMAAGVDVFANGTITFKITGEPQWEEDV